MASFPLLFRYNPWDSVARGQGVESGLARAEMEGRDMREYLAAKEAAALMGQGDYLTTFEGVPGATRPEWLKRLFATGNPDVALKMESLLSTPHAIQREVTKLGEIERAKRTADYEVANKFIQEYFGKGRPSMPQSGGGGSVAGGTSEIGEMGPTSLMGMSGEEPTFEVGPQGPKISFKGMSEFEKAYKAGSLTVEQMKERNERIQQAHTNVRNTRDAIADTHRAIQNHDIDPLAGQKRLEELTNSLNEHIAHRDALVSGKKSIPPTNAPKMVPDPGASLKTPVSPSASPTQSGRGLLTNKDLANLATENIKEKTTAANKEIANARLGAEKVLKFKRPMKELFDIVTKQDIGHPSMEGIPGATNMLSVSRANAQVKKLSEALINMFAEPGQSQMMNTIVERQMQGALVPGLFTDPQLNKINAAILRSNMEHLENFPSFLEKWQKKHGGTLDGAAEAWIDYTENNQLYSYAKDARGRVTISENNNVTPITKWLQLRESGGVRKIGDKTFMKLDDGSWVER